MVKMQKPSLSVPKSAFIGLILFILLPFGVQSQVNVLTPAEQAANWQLLFNGSNLGEHFQAGFDGGTIPWRIDDQAMASAPGSPGSEIYTKQKYSNFEFKMDWKVNETGNSGIFIRANPPRRICSCSEYAILDGVNGGDKDELGHMPGETDMPIKRSGANYDLYPGTVNAEGEEFLDASNPVGEYNTTVIWANGYSMEHWLNGQLVVKYEIGSADWEARFEKSKYWNICKDDRNSWSKHPDGYLGFQDHGDDLHIWMRDVKIRTFEPNEKLVKPMMTPVAGTIDSTTAISLEAAITGAKIYYTTDGSTPTPETGTLYTQPFTLPETATVKAITMRENFQSSDVTSADYEVPSISMVGSAWQNPVPYLQQGKLKFSSPQTDIYKIRVFSRNGKLLLNTRLGGNYPEADISVLGAGLYILQIHSPSGKFDNRNILVL